jgi:hypothetical protein
MDMPLIDRTVTVFKCEVGQTDKNECLTIWKRSTGKEFVRQLELTAGVTTVLASLYQSQEAFDDAIENIRSKLDNQERPLKPDIRIKATQELSLLEANKEKLEPVFEITNALSSEGELSVASFENSHSLLVSAVQALPAYTELTGGMTVDLADHRTGLVWKRIESACWYDANDLAVPAGEACFIPGETNWSYFVDPTFNYFQTVNYRKRDPNKGQKAEFAKGCNLGYGMNVPSSSEFATVADHPQFHLTWLSEGSVSTVSADLRRTIDVHTWLSLKALRDAWVNSKSPKSMAIGVSCVAGAEVVFPDGDLDQDGVANRDDRCVHSPRDLKELKHVELNNNDRKGCTASQKVNEEYRKNGFSDIERLATISSTHTGESSPGTVGSWTPQNLGVGDLRVSSINSGGQKILTIGIHSRTVGGVAFRSGILLNDLISQVDGQNIVSEHDFLEKLNRSKTRKLTILRGPDRSGNYSITYVTLTP